MGARTWETDYFRVGGRARESRGAGNPPSERGRRPERAMRAQKNGDAVAGEVRGRRERGPCAVNQSGGEGAGNQMASARGGSGRARAE